MMGLDLTAYQGIRLIGKAATYDEYDERFDWSDTVYVHPQIDFAEWATGLVLGGVYSYTNEWDFHAGSYSGYNYWRAHLCQWSLHTSPQVVWNADPEQYIGRPFYRLIHFSDCDGYIGPEFCKQLAHDFEDHLAAMRSADWDDWDQQRYMDFLKAFQIASDDGFVKFH
jgi:hypothetical protein